MGKISNLTNMFQMGWNHQLVKIGWTNIQSWNRFQPFISMDVDHWIQQKPRGSWCLHFWKEPEVAKLSFLFFASPICSESKMVIHFCNDDCNSWSLSMIFQQEKVCSLHKKTPSLVFVATMVLPGMASGFQAGEDWYGMLGFYLGAGDEEDDFLRFFRDFEPKKFEAN